MGLSIVLAVTVAMLHAGRANAARREHHWTMDLGHLKAELDRLAGEIERSGGRVTERDLNYVEDSAEPVLRAAGERHVNLPQEAGGSATWVAPLATPARGPTPTPRTQNRTICAPLRQ